MSTSDRYACSTTEQRPTFKMPPELQHREAPVLLIVGKDGKGEMTNYRVKDQTYIVNRLFDRANLVLGSGKKAQEVEISSEHKH